MNFKFNAEEQKVIDRVHEFGVNEVAPLAAEIDKEDRFPEESRKRLADLGMMGICYPKEYGGAGLSYLAYIAVIEELAKHCASTAIMVSAHHSLGSFPLMEFGTEEQKQKFLAPLLKGEKLGAFGATEPAAGSDLKNQQTMAVDMGDHWLLNGTKIFITNGFYADTYFVTAVTDKSQGSRGISGFIVEKGTPGFTFGAKEKKMGIHGSATYELVFQNCKVPKENLLGKLGSGYKMALTTLSGGRIGVAAQALGIAQSAIDHCKKYVTEHTRSGRRISEHQFTQFEMADMQARVDAARLLVYRAAQAKQDHESFLHLASMGKLYAAEAATNVTHRCIQLVGYEGYTRDLPFERLMRDAKITEIYEGTSEVQRMVISSWMGVK